MRTRQHYAEFANFICRFDNDKVNKVMMDYAEEIVLPAFLDDTLIRGYGDTHYFLYDASLEIINDDKENPVLAIVGRFIKNTTLSRTQLFDEKAGLVQDQATIQSSPSAFFVLILNNHRLLYLPETPHAPNLQNFQSTIKYFLKKKHEEFINTKLKASNEGEKDKNKKVSKKTLRTINPPPSLKIVPLTSEDAIGDFIKRFEILKSIEFQLIKPNDDIDGSEIFKDIREMANDLKSDSSKLTCKNPDGLSKTKAVEKVNDAAKAGNQSVKLQGVDHDGNSFGGDNHNFRIRSPIEVTTPVKKAVTTRLYDKFKSLVSSGTIRIDKSKGDNTDKIKKLHSEYIDD